MVECETMYWTKIPITTNHSYSIESIRYIKSLNTDIITLINPWDTKVKYYITVDEACKIFDIREVTYINIEKMFK